MSVNQRVVAQAVERARQHIEAKANLERNLDNLRRNVARLESLENIPDHQREQVKEALRSAREAEALAMATLAQFDSPPATPADKKKV